MSAPVGLDDLRRFTVDAVEPSGPGWRLTGRVTAVGTLAIGDSLELFVPDPHSLTVRVAAVDLSSRTAALVTRERPHEVVVPGYTAPLLNSGSEWLTRLVLDRSLAWRLVRFSSQPAFVKLHPDGTREWRPAAPGDEHRTDGEVVPAMWDHEHCAFCNCHISESDEPEGHTFDGNTWVCVTCFNAFVSPPDLRFVLEGHFSAKLTPDERQATAPSRALERLIGEHDLPAVRTWVESGNDVDARSAGGSTALMTAAERDLRDLARLLLELGADVNATSVHGYTPLALAAQDGRADMVELLLAAGASPHVHEDFWGGSLLTFVRSGPGGNDQELLQRLKRAGAT